MTQAAVLEVPEQRGWRAFFASDRRLLAGAATPFTAAVLFHNSDHLRRGGDSVSTEVFWLGSAAILVEVWVVAMVVRRDPSADLAAIAAGLPLALGYVFVHFTPERSWVSDSFLEGGAAVVSLLAASIESVAALALFAAGWAVWRRRAAGPVAGGAAALPWPAAFRHPLVLAMAFGNAVIFVGSLLTR